MGTHCHQQVGKSLSEEQHYICCYCETAITANDNHIEHMVPRSADPSRKYDYQNLAASCNGGPVEHCGRFKDDRHRNPSHRYDPALFCLPHGPGTARLFQYLPNGKVQPATGLNAQDISKANYMIGYLGLNCARLTGRRRALAGSLMATLGDNPDPDTRGWLVDYYLQPDPDGRLQPYHSLSKTVLDV